MIPMILRFPRWEMWSFPGGLSPPLSFQTGRPLMIPVVSSKLSPDDFAVQLLG